MIIFGSWKEMEKSKNESRKEFYIKSVEKYNDEIDSKKKNITMDIVLLGVASLAILASIIGSCLTAIDMQAGLAELNVFLRHIFTGIFFSLISLHTLIRLIKNISCKSGLEIRIDEIEELFAFHGLSLEEEISKSKSMRMR